MSNKLSNTTKDGGRGNANYLLAVAAGAAMVGVTAPLLNAIGENSSKAEINALKGADKIYKGTMLFGSGAKFRKAPVIFNGDDGGTPDNVRFTVGEDKTEVVTNPVEFTDTAGDTWVGVIKKGTKQASDFDDLAKATSWANLTQLKEQGLVTEVDPGAHTTSIVITAKGIVENAESHKAFDSSMTAAEIATSSIDQLGDLGLLKAGVRPPQS